ncbi:hypothetical protein AAHN97_22645 [Chitinophaga niabensis]|uniref:hypothetical protein n=1 Tax=Chitinophaga niabensis TaxID=536979 RepID=UPI0031BA628B
MFRLSFLLLLIPFIGDAQQAPKRTIMIHTHGDRTLVTLIEKSLGRLRVGDSLRFEHVTNLNQIYNTAMIDTIVRTLIDRGPYINFKLTPEQEKNLKELATTVSQYELLLSVNINKVNALLEYQFYLYSTDTTTKEKTQQDSTAHWPTKNLLKPRYLNSFFIDVSSPDYSERIDREVAKMFPETEQAPVAVISSGSKKAQETFIGIKDTIRLDGSVLSNDHEVSARKLQYYWYREILSPDTGGHKILVSEKPSLELPSDRLSDNRFFLKVFDGVHYSNFDSVDIHIKAKPEIYLVDTVISTYYHRSLFKSKDRIQAYAHILSSSLSRSDVSKLQLYVWDRRIDTFNVKKEYYSGKRYKRRSTYKDWINLSMEEALLPREDQINLKVEKTEDGYDINFDNDANHDFYVNYFIEEQELNVSSNSVNLTVEHRAYPMYSFILNYNHLEFGALNKSIEDTIDAVIHEARFGIALSLYRSEQTGIALEADATVGFSANTPRRVTMSRTLQGHLYFKKWVKYHSMALVVGAGYTLFTVESEVPLNRFTYNEWKPGISVGIESQPVRWCTLFFGVNGNFSKMEAHGYQISSQWMNIRLKFHIPQ